MEKKIKLGIIGVGNMGAAHAFCIAKGEIEGIELVAICDNDNEKADFFAKTYSVESYTDYAKMINSGSLDAVIIATPHPFHAQIAMKALENDIHVLLEKPADITVSRVQALNEVSQKSGKVFSIMFNQRTNPLFQKAREIVRGGLLGDLKRAIWIVTNWYRTQSYYNSSDWRATWSGEGGGVLVNQAPHNLDILQWICGMPQSVTAFCEVGKYHNIEVEDEASLFLRYQNGATATFLTSTGEYPGTNRLEISGTRGKIVLEDATLKWWRLKEDEREVCYQSDQSFAEIASDYTEYKDAAVSGHQIILQNFVNAIRFGEELIAPGTHGIYELTISNAAYLSQWKENAEIRLPFDCSEFDRELSKRAKIGIPHGYYLQNNTEAGYQERWNVRW